MKFYVECIQLTGFSIVFLQSRADSTTSDNSRHVLNETRSTRASYGDTPSSYSLVAKDLNLHNADCPYVRWCRASELLMTDDDLRKELINSSRQDLMEISGESASLFEVRIEPNVRAAENDGPGSVRHYVDAQRNMLADNRNEAARQCKCPRAKLIQDPTVSSTSPETEPIESDEEDLDDVDYE